MPNGADFIAVSDAGSWLTGRLVLRDGRLSSIGNARMGPLLALSGRRLVRRRDKDAEAFRFVSGTLARGRALAAFERNARVGLYRVRDGRLLAPLSYLRPPIRLPYNKGFEAVTVLTHGPFKGAVVAFAERAKDGNDHHRGWLWVGGRPRPVAVVDEGGFDLTDAVTLPDGGLVLLERRFRWSEGVQFRLRHILSRDVRPGAVLAGTTLLKADMRAEIDNMEGLAAHRNAHGETILTLISDNNFNGWLQRTLMLQFALPKPASTRAAVRGGARQQ